MTLAQFQNHKYLNIETFRKNGQGIKTPVWFVQDGETLRIWTFAGAGKIKRIRNNGRVTIAPSDSRGTPLGEWIEARATAEDTAAAIQHTESLMRKKYGLAFLVFWGLGKLRRSQAATFKVEIASAKDASQ